MSSIFSMISDPKVLAVLLGICGTGLNSLAIQKQWSRTVKDFAAGGVALVLAGITGAVSGKFTGNMTDVSTLLTYGAIIFTTARTLYVSIEASFPIAQPLTKLQEATTLKKTMTPLPPT